MFTIQGQGHLKVKVIDDFIVLNCCIRLKVTYSSDFNNFVQLDQETWLDMVRIIAQWATIAHLKPIVPAIKGSDAKVNSAMLPKF